jgi:hypothetical protein
LGRVLDALNLLQFYPHNNNVVLKCYFIINDKETEIKIVKETLPNELVIELRFVPARILMSVYSRDSGERRGRTGSE